MKNLVEAGASDASNVAEMSKEVEVVISMLPSNQHVLDVYTGENGVLRYKTNFHIIQKYFLQILLLNNMYYCIYFNLCVLINFFIITF